MSDDVIKGLLELAARAPTCRLAQPWRFHVIGDHTRQELTQLGLEVMSAHACTKAGEGTQRMLLEAPRLLAVSAHYQHGANERRIDEDYAAVCCCIQNPILAAHDRDLSIWWRTGALVRHEHTHFLLQLEDGEQLVGILTVGYAETGVHATLKPASSHTRWLP